MESSAYINPTLALFRRTRERSGSVGLAIQAYLHRSARDIEAPAAAGSGDPAGGRGRTWSQPQLPFPKKADVDANFVKLSERLLGDEAQRAGAHLHIGTHNSAIVGRLGAFISGHHVPEAAYQVPPCSMASSGRCSSGWSMAASGCAC